MKGLKRAMQISSGIFCFFRRSIAVQFHGTGCNPVVCRPSTVGKAVD